MIFHADSQQINSASVLINTAGTWMLIAGENMRDKEASQTQLPYPQTNEESPVSSAFFRSVLIKWRLPAVQHNRELRG
jgi:hypothetical protein